MISYNRTPTAQFADLYNEYDLTVILLLGLYESGCYRSDEDLQSLLFGAGIFGDVEHRPCGATAVQL